MALYLEQVAKEYHPDNCVTRCDVSSLYEEEFANCPNEQCYCSPYTLLRLFADKMPRIPDKLLYLDVDILFNRDIMLLYDMDIEGYEYAQPEIITVNIWCILIISMRCTLLNMKEIRRTGLFEKARELIKDEEAAFCRSECRYSEALQERRCCRRGSTIRSFCISIR